MSRYRRHQSAYGLTSRREVATGLGSLAGCFALTIFLNLAAVAAVVAVAVVTYRVVS